MAWFSFDLFGSARREREKARVMETAVDSVSSAVMMVDRDLVITHVNKTTVDMLREYAEHFRTLWPGFDPDKIVGTNIDVFHKQPSHQRKLLADPRNLPYRTEITVGPLRFTLNVHAVTDTHGNYTGNILEWAEVSALRAKEAENALYKSMYEAIDRAQAIIEFTLEGKVVDANKHFLDALGYTLDEIKGQHHSIFVDPAYRQTADYRLFWDKLGRGEYDAGQYKRIGKGGKEVWIQASYNPILDVTGKPVKVVKFATDITEEVRVRDGATTLQRAVDNLSNALMMIDRDFKVTYINDSTKAMLSKHVDEFRKIWPGFDPSKIVGTCIDMFHKDPSHQRRMLSDPSRLPYRTDISVGSLKINLCVNASFDPSGAYIGNILEWGDVTELRRQEAINNDYRGQIAAISKAQAVIEFDLTGKVLDANENFCKALGYTLDEIKGQHHSLFVDPAFRQTAEYKMFWDKLGRGEYDAGQYKRIGKGGKEVWIQASYNPIIGLDGKPFKVVKFATDITEERLKAADFSGQLEAISKAQAVIEFSLDGKVVWANENFCKTLGYTLDEIKGQHHSMFVDPVFRQTADYRMFWDKLGRGEYDAGQYKRIGRGGREVWIQASYNPIMDLNGKPFKVVKYATDITEEKLKAADYAGQLDAISKAQAVIEFGLDGRVVWANPNFLSTLGFSLEEIKGQHHSMFVDPSERQTTEYRMFWEKLGRGEYDAGQYKRIGKGGKEVWIQASYNPIMDLNGKPFKVVKYATDITPQVMASRAMQSAVAESQGIIAAAQSNDLTKRISLVGKSGDLEQLCGGINSLLDTMGTVVANILSTSSTIASAVGEITNGTNDLSKRTEQQASSLEETAASMEEMASTIKLNADNAQQANQLAISARTTATDGGAVVNKAVDAMSRIENSSQKISDIIGVIDEIAFQTNLLALNAAVEAARAGDAGKGFAVVASEVRSLAQRSSGAAKDIKALIAASGSQVKDGVKLVNDAGTALNEIVGSIKKVADIVSEIAAASKEQSTGVEEINKAVSAMDEMTQQNSALVEENAAACRLLQDQAEAMQQRMSQFELDERALADAPAVTKLTRPAHAATGAKPAAKPAPRKAVATARGGAARMQAELQNAFQEDDWKEF